MQLFTPSRFIQLFFSNFYYFNVLFRVFIPVTKSEISWKEKETKKKKRKGKERKEKENKIKINNKFKNKKKKTFENSRFHMRLQRKTLKIKRLCNSNIKKEKDT